MMRNLAWVLGFLLLFVVGCQLARDAGAAIGGFFVPPLVPLGEPPALSLFGTLAAMLPPPWNYLGGAAALAIGEITRRSVKNSAEGEVFGPVAAKKEGESTDKPPAATA